MQKPWKTLTFKILEPDRSRLKSLVDSSDSDLTVSAFVREAVLEKLNELSIKKAA